MVIKKVISRNSMLGIIGYGNVGKLLSKILENLNIKHKFASGKLMCHTRCNIDLKTGYKLIPL